MWAVAFVCALLTCAVLVWLLWDERRRHRQDQTAHDKLEKLAGKLEGYYDSLTTQAEARVSEREAEVTRYKELTTDWRTRIEEIGTSLSKLSTDASQKVGDMASLLKPIVTIFRSPQTAGIKFGEGQLELLLRAHLGEGLYVRKPALLAVGTDVVDFAIKLPECLVPIDSKFPAAYYQAWMEASEGKTAEEAKSAWRAFRDQLLKQLETTSKYINPRAGTTDYALLFVPSDAIYLQAFVTEKLYDLDNPVPRRTAELQVFGCSPQTLMPIFNIIRLGLRNLRVAEDVKEIRQHIDELDRVFFKAFLGEDWGILRRHVENLKGLVDRMGTDRGSVGRLGEAIRKLHDISQRSESVKTPGAPSTSAELLPSVTEGP